jgi:hypothetical protein
MKRDKNRVCVRKGKKGEKEREIEREMSAFCRLSAVP